MLRSFVKFGFAIVCCLALPAATHAAECSVAVGFAGDARVSGAVVEVHYARSGVSFIGNGEDVECHVLAPGVLATFNDEQDVLSAALIRVEPFGGPALFECTVTGAEVDAAALHVETVDASDSDSQAVSPLPESVITSVDCGDDGADQDVQFCDAVFTVESAQKVSGLTYETNYGNAAASPVGSGDDVACKTLVPNGLGAYNDESATLTLVGALVHVAGIQGTIEIATCRFEAPDGLEAADLDVAVTDAVSPDGQQLAETPQVFVSSVKCGTEGELSGDDGGGDGGGVVEQCEGPYEITFAVTGDANLGALQLVIDYSGSGGTFAGAGDAVQCSAAVGGLAMFNDNEGSKRLRVGIISAGGFQAPADVVTCVFERAGGAPAAAGFSVEIQDASHVDGSDAVPAPEVHLSEVVGANGSQCGEPAPACGNAVVDAGEECDDGNLDDNDGCLANCATAACGDIDGNGTLTATDARRALNAAVGIAGDCSLVRCDVNASGSVTATDARMILNASVGITTPLDCGS